MEFLAMSKALVWLRRDLRLWDNHALSLATTNHDEVDIVFVFDKNILDKLPKDDHRVEFLFNVLDSLKGQVSILYGDPVKKIVEFAKKKKSDIVYTNRDYESYAKDRDAKVKDLLFEESINFKSVKDQVIFEKNQVLNGKGEFYKVFTPYKNRYLELLSQNKDELKTHKVDKKKINNSKINEAMSLDEIGFKRSSIEIPSIDPIKKVKSFLKNDIDDYKDKRDFPSSDATSGLSLYIRFGLVSIRSLFIKAQEHKSKGRKVWISELIWRDFYSMLLQADDRIEDKPFNDKYDDFKWDKDKKLLKWWKEGKTGFPFVDAGMRQLNKTGFMHNRLRMVVASHLSKTLLLDYREGEEYLAQKLFDFDLASNNGGWQWASSTGCDAAPYFRVFNPYRQSERFDKEGEYIKKYIPELKNVPKKYIHDPSQMTEAQQKEYGVIIGKDYPAPIVDYSKKRKEIIQRFKDHG